MNSRDLYWAAVKSDLRVFVIQCFNTLLPDQRFEENWHIQAILYQLERCITGKQRRLIINLPPRHLKSMLVSVVLPAFILGHDPTAKIICVSYSDELVRTLAREFRRIMESEWYRALFPNVEKAKATENEYVTRQGGYRYAISVNGSLTGRGGDFVIIDDPIKPEDALSDRLRDQANNWFKSTLLSRLDDKQHSCLIIVMQRLHVNDLTGYVQDSGGYYKLSLPAIALKDDEIPISATETYCRKAGEPLHAERESLDTLEDMRNRLGEFIFSAQYQQQPECPDGVIFKREYLKILTRMPERQRDGFFWVSVDAAASTSVTADFSAITIGYTDLDGHIILRVDRGRWGIKELVAKSLGYAKRLPEVTFVVEQASNGYALCDHLRDEGIYFVPYHAKEDKVMRASKALSIFAGGRVRLLRLDGRDAWIDPLVIELVSFPFGKFDDQVDSLVQGVRWAEKKIRSLGRVYLC